MIQIFITGFGVPILNKLVDFRNVLKSQTGGLYNISNNQPCRLDSILCSLEESGVILFFELKKHQQLPANREVTSRFTVIRGLAQTWALAALRFC